MSQVPIYDPYAFPDNAIQDPPESLWKALRKIGPGIILAGSIVGSGELIVTTGLGAKYGFVFLWLILFSCIIKVFVQIELGRFAISSGKPTLGALNELPGPRLGAHWLVWWWFGMLLCTVSQLGGMTGSVGQALNLGFPAVSAGVADFLNGFAPALAEKVRERPEYPWAFLTCAVAILLLRTGGYRRVELLTTILVASVTFLTLLCALALFFTEYAPNWGDVFAGLSPVDSNWAFTIPAAGIAAAFSAFGITGVGASELYSYPYWCLEKGYARFAGKRDESEGWAKRARGWIRVLQLDAWASMLVFTIATVAFYVMGAAVLNPMGKHPEGPAMIEMLSHMYVGPFGKWTQVVFLVGAGCTLFKTLYVSAASHSRLTTDLLSLAGIATFPDSQSRGRVIQRFCIFYPILALVLFLLFGDPVAMVIAGGIAQAATLPIICGATLYLRFRRTDPRVAPSRLSDTLLLIAAISITVVAVYAISSKVLGWLAS